MNKFIYLLFSIILFSSGVINVYASQNLKIIFLGTTSIYISDGTTHIMTDGFFSYPKIRNVLFGKIKPDTILIINELNEINITSLDYIIPLHAHYDHLMDAPFIAKKYSAQFIGTKSTINVAKANKINNFIEISNNDSINIGEFTIYFFIGDHSKFTTFNKIFEKKDSKISDTLHIPNRRKDYKTGEVISLLIKHPQGNLLVSTSEKYEKLPILLNVDLALLNAAAISKNHKKKETYYNLWVKDFNVKAIAPIHWNSLFIGTNFKKKNHCIGRRKINSSLKFLKNKAIEDNKRYILPEYGKQIIYY